MDKGSSFIDESLAVGGMMTILGAFVWTLPASDATTTVEAKDTQTVRPATLKQAA